MLSLLIDEIDKIALIRTITATPRTAIATLLAVKKEYRTNLFASCNSANEQFANSVTFDCHQDQEDHVDDVDNDEQ